MCHIQLVGFWYHQVNTCSSAKIWLAFCVLKQNQGWTTQVQENVTWLVVSTHFKNISQIGSFPQVGVKIKSIWNHQPVTVNFGTSTPPTIRLKIISLAFSPHRVATLCSSRFAQPSHNSYLKMKHLEKWLGFLGISCGVQISLQDEFQNHGY